MDAGLPRPWLDGQRPTSEPCLDPAAPGVFETLRCEAGVPLLADAHLARLEHGAHSLGLPFPPPWDALEALHTLAGEGLRCALRLDWRPPHLALVARPLPDPPPSPVLRLLAPGRVAPPLPHGVKTARRAAYDEARAATRALGAFEALVRTVDGRCIEGTVTNLFVALEGEVRTPPLASGALPGIVRALLLTQDEPEALRDEHGRSWRLVEREVGARDLVAAEEILLTNSLVGVVGVSRLLGEDLVRDDLPGAGGPLARVLGALVLRIQGACSWPRFPRGQPG